MLSDKSNGIGAMIRALRRQAKMTQTELGERCGLERTSICNIETGRQTLTVQSVNAIAAALGHRVKIKFERIETPRHEVFPPGSYFLCEDDCDPWA